MYQRLLVGTVLFSLLSVCLAQPDWELIPIGTWTSRRLMSGAADYLGLTLVQELFARKKVRLTLQCCNIFSGLVYTEFVLVRLCRKLLAYRNTLETVP